MGNISRSISPQAKQMQPKTFVSPNIQTSSSKEKISLRERPASSYATSREKMFREKPPKLAPYTYILEYKR